MAVVPSSTPATPASTAGWQGIARVAAAGNAGRWLRDGVYAQVSFVGAPGIELPFQQWGDRTTAIWKQKCQQAFENWTAQPAYTTHPDRGDLYLIKETPIQIEGPALANWERWYCPVPIPHNEPEAFPYSFQYADSASSFASITRSVSSQVLYEYFLAQDEAAFPILKKTAVSVVPTTAINAAAAGGITLIQTGTGQLNYNRPGAFIVSPDAWIVAEDSKIGTWNDPIMFRATRMVPGPTIADLGGIWVPGTGTTGQSVVLQFDLSVSPASIAPGQSAALTFTGSGTAWTSGTTFTASAGTLSGLVINVAAQTATATYAAPASAQIVQITGSDNSVVLFTVAASS